jgi:hypothetical protein
MTSLSRQLTRHQRNRLERKRPRLHLYQSETSLRDTLSRFP